MVEQFKSEKLNLMVKDKIKELIEFYIIFAKIIEEETNVKMDYAIYTLPASCLIKLAYSIDVLNNDFSIVKPIFYNELLNCKIEDFLLKNNKYLDVRNRSLCLNTFHK